MLVVDRAGRPHPLVLAVTATLGAAALVFYLQNRALASLDAQARVILQQVSEQAAADVALELRRALGGPVFDTLTAVNHPELRAGRLDLVGDRFAQGLVAYPHVDRFFVWQREPELARDTSDRVMFYGRQPGAAFDPALSRALVALADRYASTQQIYVAAEGVGPEGRFQAFLRLFWEDARRRRYFAILGFVVDPDGLRERLLDPPRRARIESLLTRSASGAMPLELRLRDDDGAVVYGSPAAAEVEATLPFPMLFYPLHDIHSRLAAAVPPRTWRIEVLAPPTAASASPGAGYWPTLLTIALMLAALGATVRAHRRSEELSAMQRDFVAHVSHQLKTPLSALRTATETLRLNRVRSAEKQAQYLEIVHAEAERLTVLVHRVLEFSRLREPRRYELEVIDLGALVEETVAAFAQGVPGAAGGIRVVHEGQSPLVRADPAALEQVLVNLLDNAVKYAGPASETTVRVAADERRAIIAIVDRGPGIDPHDRPRIFDRFYRGAGTAGREGFGLGLAIVRELVDAHGGSVAVESAPGLGTTVTVTLSRTWRLDTTREEGS